MKIAMLKKRDTYNYSLNIGPVVVYIGITQHPGIEKMSLEYSKARDKLRFTHMTIDEKPQTYDEAKREAEKQLEEYQKEHDGELPRYNQAPDSSIEHLRLSAATA